MFLGSLISEGFQSMCATILRHISVKLPNITKNKFGSKMNQITQVFNVFSFPKMDGEGGGGGDHIRRASSLTQFACLCFGQYSKV